MSNRRVHPRRLRALVCALALIGVCVAAFNTTAGVIAVGSILGLLVLGGLAAWLVADDR